MGAWRRMWGRRQGRRTVGRFAESCFGRNSDSSRFASLAHVASIPRHPTYLAQRNHTRQPVKRTLRYGTVGRLFAAGHAGGSFAIAVAAFLKLGSAFFLSRWTADRPDERLFGIPQLSSRGTREPLPAPRPRVWPGHRGSCVLRPISRRVLAGGGWQTGCMEYLQESNVAVANRAKKPDNNHYVNDFRGLRCRLGSVRQDRSDVDQKVTGSGRRTVKRVHASYVPQNTLKKYAARSAQRRNCPMVRSR
jgi:hypothetical protein